MSYQRLYPQRINWEDEPSLATPINQVNLNKMDSALYGIDGRVVELDENKVGKTETFNTSRNGVVPKPTQADITNEKVLRADGAWVEQSGGGGGGGGHTYVDKDDNQMPPRGKAKFTGGLNLTDDSENNRTIVDDNYEIIPWATWQDYSDAEKAQHPNAIVTGAPDCDGTLEIENFHLAWENPNPTSTFASQTITLDTDDYDLIHIECRSVGYNTETEISKGANANCQFIAGTSICSRLFTRTSDTQYSVGDGKIGTVTNNDYLVPQKIYTYKKSNTAKIKAIAHNVSTDASKCMIDENTSVADALNYSATEHAVGKWIDGSTLYEKTIVCGVLPNNTTKNVEHGITNLQIVVEIKGFAYASGISLPLPYSDTNTAGIVRVLRSGEYIQIRTAQNMNDYAGVITLRYTKTS